jgi:light-regulated signal transduction histidine kinase (bacteriophytochrome)
MSTDIRKNEGIGKVKENMRYTIPEDNFHSVLIAQSDVISKLATIFEDSIILDGRFRIVMVSSNVQHMLGYAADALKGQSVNALVRGEGVEHVLQEVLAPGFFEEIIISLHTSTDTAILFGLSGFYLGLISDLNGYIVLKLKNLDIIRRLNRQLEDNRHAMESFIYYTAQDLNGPVAALRSIIATLKSRKDDKGMGLLATTLDVQVIRLEERLTKLLQLTDAGSQPLPFISGSVAS